MTTMIIRVKTMEKFSWFVNAYDKKDKIIYLKSYTWDGYPVSQRLMIKVFEKLKILLISMAH